MKEKLMREIQQAMNGKLSDRQKEQLANVVRSCLQRYQISELVEPAENVHEGNVRLQSMFISAKQIEGCAKRTEEYYLSTLNFFIKTNNRKIIQASLKTLMV